MAKNKAPAKGNKSLKELEEDIAGTIRGIFGGNKEAKDIKVDEWLTLKKAAGQIDNLVTRALTEKFVEELYANHVIDKAARDYIMDELKSKSVNANGYDVNYKDANVRILAEVKANIPYGKNKYGAEQKKGIKKDLEGSIYGKAKGGVQPAEIGKYLRFMVILEVDGARGAMNNLIKNYKYTGKINIVDSKPIAADKINVVFLKL